MKKTHSKAFLFDFDGTLVDSMPTYAGVMLRILDEYQIPYCDDIVSIITPLGYRGTAEYFQKIGLNETVDVLMEKMRLYMQDEYQYHILEKSRVSETLQALKKRGESLNVLTASPHSALDPCLKRLELWDLFENIWSCDDFNTTKSDPEIYHRAAEKMGFDVSEVVFIDDNLNAVKTAKIAGMQAYGIYDKSSHDLINEMKACSDRYLMNFSELL